VTTARRSQRDHRVGRDRFVWFLLLLTICERLAFQLGNSDRSWPFPIFYEGDAEAFFNYAQSILLGTPYDNGIPFHPPLFPLWLAGFHGVLGDPVPNGLLRSILTVLSALIPVGLYRFVRDAIGRSAAIATGLLSAFSFGFDILGCSVTSEGLFLLLFLGLLLSLRTGPSRGRKGLARNLRIGILCGMLALTRGEGIVLAAMMAGVWIANHWRKDRSRSIAAAGAILAGIVIVLTPWTIRNAMTLARWNQTVGTRIGLELNTFVPVSAYGPLNFALANHDGATGEFQRSLLSSGADQAILDLSDPQHAHYFVDGTAEGLRWIVQHPNRFASLALRKLDIASRAYDLGWTPWNLPHGLRGTRRPVDLFAPDAGGVRWLQIGLAFLGLTLLYRRREMRGTVRLLVAPPIGFLIVTILFFGYVRLGMLAAPSIFIFEGVALAAVASRLPDAVGENLRRPIVVWSLTISTLIVLILGGTQNRNYNATGTTHRPGGMLSRDASIRIEPISGSAR